MNKYPVYRTEKGNLTFTEHGEAIYVISAKSLEIAKEGLKDLKRAEKNIEENNVSTGDIG